MRYLIFSFCLLFSIQNSFGQQFAGYPDTTFNKLFMRHDSNGWTAGDATISVPVPCLNKTIWLFGDSYIGHLQMSDTTLPCLFQVRNTMMVQDLNYPDSFITILDTSQTGVHRTPIMAPDTDTSLFWPGAGYAVHDTVYIIWNQYDKSPLKKMGTWVATIIADSFVNASNIISLKRLNFLPDTAAGFGTSILVDSASGYIYVYGARRDWIVDKPLVARFPIGQSILTPWEFYDGSGWTPNIDSAANLFSNSDYVTSFSVLRAGDKYVMVSQEQGFLSCGLGRNINAWESNTPYGPFVNKTLVYTMTDGYHGHYWVTYNASAHPEFIKNNELLVSYNVNGFNNDTTTGCVSECQNVWHDRRRAVGYRPKFFRISFAAIDSIIHVPDVDFSNIDCYPQSDTDTISTAINAHYQPPIQVKIYPNPNETGTFFIRVKGVKKPLTVTVYNMLGQKIKKIQTKDGKGKIHIEEKGLYFVRFKGKHWQKTTKIVVD